MEGVDGTSLHMTNQTATTFSDLSNPDQQQHRCTNRGVSHEQSTNTRCGANISLKRVNSKREVDSTSEQFSGIRERPGLRNLDLTAKEGTNRGGEPQAINRYALRG